MLNFFSIAVFQAASILFSATSPFAAPVACQATSIATIDGGTGGWTGDIAATDGGTGGWTGDFTTTDGGTGGWTGDFASIDGGTGGWTGDIA